ncbi:HAD-IIB family hydrolase [Microbulbifer halophilus]|uniref:HAD-IIB family hydrolase n=1 Tax=Microbulbifer halophilus TaxID=453963 RepID=A0ABW5ECV2_9GAMM|nr:HAD-IIB family hydrolase [Microbulbifer halophilus]MCW8127033.1 HAD-IIB family hydrolase [Microbulbifer halophilus]
MTQNDFSHGHWLIVSDLDGTLLDHCDYSHGPVDRLLEQLDRHGVPVLLNSSKTRAEMLDLRRELSNRHPFIVENGSAIFIPADYFPEKPAAARNRGDFWIIEPGAPHKELLAYLQGDAREHGAPYLHFSAASADELAVATGLQPDQAAAAQRREYSEPLLWRGSEAEKRAFRRRAASAGFRTLEGGRFLHLLGPTDKGAATLQLLDCYRHCRPGDYRLIAAGDSPNDLDMLAAADVAVIVRPQHGAAPVLEDDSTRRVIHSRHRGPAGWRECIEPLFAPLFSDLKPQ